jgi:putative membrane protein
MQELINTIIARPYVFAFLAVFLVLAIKRWGVWRTLLWLVSGYFIAWLSEYSSIHNGFPYGEYHYVYENLKGEFLLMGVPFFDSLSYPFLIFAGYTTAEVILQTQKSHPLPDPPPSKGRVWLGGEFSLIFLGAFLTMLLDIIIDPSATMGDKWFLGKIHYYAHPGWYFGVPLTNFGGWFLVSLAVISFNVLIWHLFSARVTSHESRFTVLYPLFYIGIALFQTFMAFYIGEWLLGIIDLTIIAVIGVISWFRMRQSHQRKGP